MNNFHPKLEDTEAIYSYKVDQISLTIESLGQYFKDLLFFYNSILLDHLFPNCPEIKFTEFLKDLIIKFKSYSRSTFYNTVGSFWDKNFYFVHKRTLIGQSASAK